MKHFKISLRVLSLVLAVIMLTGTLGAVSLAADSALKEAYGSLIPTDSKMEAQISSYTFYGDSTNLYFMMFSKGKANAWYAVKIYSDKSFSDESMIVSATDEYGKAGTSPLAIKWSFKSTPSGTYYGKCYTYIQKGDVTTVDTDSIKTFTIKLNRLGRQTVELGSAANSVNGVYLTWDSLRAATMYFVYRKASGEKSWTKIATVPSSTTSYTDKTVKSSKTYYYTVKAYDGKYASLYNKTGVRITYLETPKISAITPTGSAGYATLKWNKITGAAGYYIYRKGGSLSDTSYKKIATVKGNSVFSYTDKTAVSTKWRYTYTIRAYGTNKNYSSYDKNGTIYNYFAAPQLTKAVNVAGGILVSWNDSSAVSEKYYVYRKTSSSTDKYKKIATVTEKSYTDANVQSGINYIYTVRPVASTNAGGYSASGITVLCLRSPELKTIAYNVTGNAKITWAAVSGAKSYYVYRRADSGKWERIAMLNNPKTLSYTDKAEKTSGVTYYYTVKTINGKISSVCTDTISFKWLSTPDFSLSNVTSEGIDSIRVSWDRIPGAEYYRVYRKTAEDTSWSIIADYLITLDWKDTDISSGNAYTYAVRAIDGTVGSKYYSRSAIALSEPVLTDATVTAEGNKITWQSVTGADSYYIYRKTATTAWENIGSYSQTEYVDTAADKNTAYYYSVSAVNGSNESYFDHTGIKCFTAVTDLSAILYEAQSDTEATEIRLTWSADENAKGFEVCRKTGDGEYAVIAAIPIDGETAYTDADIVQGQAYTYLVKPINADKLAVNAESAAIKWAFSPVPVIDITASVVDGTAENKAHINITWVKTETAEAYEIYRKTETGEWTLLATVPATDESSFDDMTAEAEIIYYYSVKGVAADRDSLFDETGKGSVIRIPLSPVTLYVALSDDAENPQAKNAVVTWDAVDGAAQYFIYRKTADTDWAFRGNTMPGDPNSFTDTSIEQGTTYTYTVRALAFDRESIDNETGVSITWELPVPPEPPVTPDPPVAE